MQKALEVEYWVVDEDGRLTTPDSLVDVCAGAELEFVDSLFELKTEPCESIAELRRTFVADLEAVLDRADELGKALVPLGTPIHADEPVQLPGDRSRIQREVVGENFRYAKFCAGTHLHVEQRNVVDQLNTLIALDPALALANSSPYFGGRRVADGARAYLYRKRSYEHYPKHGQLWDYADTVAQWHRRLDRRYEEFVDAAVEAGIDEDAAATHFSPDDVVWTPVRLREEMPTVEWRSPDATLPSELCRLAADVDAVMESLHHGNVRIADEGSTRTDGDAMAGDQRVADGLDGTTSSTAPGVTAGEIVLPPFESLCDLVDEAIHDGVASRAVTDYLDRMGFDVNAYDPLSRRIGGREYVGRRAAREMRLRWARALRRDVDRLSGSVESAVHDR